jgi:hypothetical protein
MPLNATIHTAANVDLEEASRSLQEKGYAALNLLSQFRRPKELYRFQKSWDDLVQDPYLPQRFGVRFRRHGRFLYDRDKSDSFILLSSAPYFQSKDVNPVAGGMKREFAPLQENVLSSSILHDCLRCSAEVFPVRECARWIINVHCIRIPCSGSMMGYPCPEGIHNDGFEYISIHVVQRRNIVGGVTFLYDNAQTLLTEEELDKPFDSVFASDTKILHYTDSFAVLSGDRGYRDTLLVSYERQL